MSMITRCTPATADAWSGRTSEDRAYIHENIQLLDLSSAQVPMREPRHPALIGYACDEGVRRNQGRTGADTGPAALRKALGKMPWLRRSAHALWDAGDIHCRDGDLEGTQQAFSDSLHLLIQKGYMPLAIGGGHDIAYGHFLGLEKSLGSEKRLGILNFDAHFDLRQPSPNSHSGSPFLQIARHCEATGREFHYGCIGVRKDANPQELWDRAAALDVTWVGREGMQLNGIEGVLKKLEGFLASLDGVYLTIDLDGFSSAFAPGVSAASPMGYSPDAFIPCLDLILRSGKLLSLDIAELNPRLDRDGQTAILAASLIHRVLHHPGLF